MPKAIIRVYLVDGRFKTMVVDSNLETKDCILLCAEKFSLTSRESFSEYRLFESVDDAVNEINPQTRPFEISQRWGAKSGDSCRFIFKRPSDKVLPFESAFAPTSAASSSLPDKKEKKSKKNKKGKADPPKNPEVDRSASMIEYSTSSSPPAASVPAAAAQPINNSPTTVVKATSVGSNEFPVQTEPASPRRPYLPPGAQPLFFASTNITPATRPQVFRPPEEESRGQYIQPSPMRRPPGAVGMPGMPMNNADEIAQRLGKMKQAEAEKKQKEEIHVKSIQEWMNVHLSQRHLIVNNLLADLRDGVILANLIEVLSGNPVKFIPNPKTATQSIDNLNSSLLVLQSLGVTPKGCGAEDIYKGVPNAVIGFMLLIIKHFGHVSDTANHRFSVTLTSQGNILTGGDPPLDLGSLAEPGTIPSPTPARVSPINPAPINPAPVNPGRGITPNPGPTRAQPANNTQRGPGPTPIRGNPNRGVADGVRGPGPGRGAVPNPARSIQPTDSVARGPTQAVGNSPGPVNQPPIGRAVAQPGRGIQPGSSAARMASPPPGDTSYTRPPVPSTSDRPPLKKTEEPQGVSPTQTAPQNPPQKVAQNVPQNVVQKQPVGAVDPLLNPTRPQPGRNPIPSRAPAVSVVPGSAQQVARPDRTLINNGAQLPNPSRTVPARVPVDNSRVLVDAGRGQDAPLSNPGPARPAPLSQPAGPARKLPPGAQPIYGVKQVVQPTDATPQRVNPGRRVVSPGPRGPPASQQPIQKGPVQQPITPVQQPITPVQQPITPVQQPITPVQQPIRPAQPITPVQQPIKPVQPIIPVQPVVPVQPIIPVQPVASVQPIIPVQPVASIQPARPAVQVSTRPGQQPTTIRSTSAEFDFAELEKLMGDLVQPEVKVVNTDKSNAEFDDFFKSIEEETTDLQRRLEPTPVQPIALQEEPKGMVSSSWGVKPSRTVDPEGKYGKDSDIQPKQETLSQEEIKEAEYIDWEAEQQLEVVEATLYEEEPNQSLEAKPDQSLEEQPDQSSEEQQDFRDFQQQEFYNEDELQQQEFQQEFREEEFQQDDHQEQFQQQYEEQDFIEDIQPQYEQEDQGFTSEEYYDEVPSPSPYTPQNTEDSIQDIQPLVIVPLTKTQQKQSTPIVISDQPLFDQFDELEDFLSDLAGELGVYE